MTVLADLLLSAITTNPPGWEEFSKCLITTKDLEQALHNVALSEDTVEILVAATWEIISSKDSEFYEELLKGTVSFPLADLFRYLLRTADSHIRVVTTNYDRLAEYAANYVHAYVSTGLTAGWLQRFVPASVNAETAPAPGYEGQVTVNTQPLMVTPGVTKYRAVHKDPFRTVLTAADAVLRRASCYVCVGYGFNDEHVQPILVNWVMKSDIPLVLVTKELTERTRQAFLANPPKKFIFLEEADGGTRVYNPEHPDGVCLDDVSVWKLENFMGLITGEKTR
jgi:hypothetical protein